jgi:cell filamentation protein
MRHIHQHLFQDVYAWAGEPRRVPMTKKNTSYADPTEMNALLRTQYAGLAEQDSLRSIDDREDFTRRLAGFWAELNHGHAFREGNTRSQTVFFEQLAHEAGWTLDAARLSPHHPLSVYKDFVDARFEHQRIRGAEGLSAQEAALDLANVLYKLIERDRTPEGSLRRGAATSEAVRHDPVRIISQDPDRTVKVLALSGIKPTADGFLDFSGDAEGGLAAGAPVARQSHTRHPELRDMKHDPYGLIGENDPSPEPDTEYQH